MPRPSNVNIYTQNLNISQNKHFVIYTIILLVF
jgi:hypothetical protein